MYYGGVAVRRVLRRRWYHIASMRPAVVHAAKVVVAVLERRHAPPPRRTAGRRPLGRARTIWPPPLPWTVPWRWRRTHLRRSPRGRLVFLLLVLLILDGRDSENDVVLTVLEIRCIADRPLPPYSDARNARQKSSRWYAWSCRSTGVSCWLLQRISAWSAGRRHDDHPLVEVPSVRHGNVVVAAAVGLRQQQLALLQRHVPPVAARLL
jgi:hypothetical protein